MSVPCWTQRTLTEYSAALHCFVETGLTRHRHCCCNVVLVEQDSLTEHVAGCQKFWSCKRKENAELSEVHFTTRDAISYKLRELQIVIKVISCLFVDFCKGKSIRNHSQRLCSNLTSKQQQIILHILSWKTSIVDMIFKLDDSTALSDNNYTIWLTRID